jgi:trans-aconitate 2-methyltransferase
MWDPDQYAKFSRERARPFHDLLAQVRLEQVRSAADLGCGPGELTRTLTERWPAASVVGVDNSPEMLARAQTYARPSRLRFVQADLATWQPEGPLDLLVSNAALQWASDHARILASWAAFLAPGGVLAVQIPSRFRSRTQDAIDAAVSDPRWSDRLAGVGLNRDSVKPLTWYVRHLLALGLEVNAWMTTYLHVLPGEDAALEWLKGTALRPLLARLSEEQAEAFQQQLGQRLRAAYPRRHGTTVFPFPRIFFVASRPQVQAAAASRSEESTNARHP